MISRILAVLLVALYPLEAAQDISDAELERVSAGRSVRVRTGVNGTVAVVDLPMEVYVARVLAAEGEPRAAAAAQEALAIAIRTYAVVNSGRHRREGFDFCDGTHCQVLRPATPASRFAALTTASQLLTYDGRPAAVFYSASCGGRSEAASEVWAGATDLPYLRSADDDVHDGDEPWVVEIPIDTVQQRLHRIGFEGRRLKDVDVEQRSESGRVTRLGLSGLRPDAITGEDFRAAIGGRELKSTRFSVEKDHDTFRFTGRGYGHGVGMCVVGAGRRAARGETMPAILQKYYPGLTVQAIGALSNAVTTTPLAEVPRPASAADALARRARTELSAVLGIASAPEVRVQIHETVDAFRTATGRPWWATHAVTGSLIELPPPLIDEGEGINASVRRAVAEVLVADALADRPTWVRVGAARYYATTSQPAPPGRRVKCPTDSELTMPVSAPAYRDAELRAEACFARGLAKTRNWRTVR